VIGLAVALLLALAAVLIFKSRKAGSTATSAPSQIMGERARQAEDKIIRGEILTGADIAGLSAYELRVLRNVHFARHGRNYDSPGLGDYFSTRPWYKPNAAYNDSLITATDKANINLILPEENRIKAAESASVTIAPAATQPATKTDSFSAGPASNSEPTTSVIQAAISGVTLRVLRQVEMGNAWQTVQIKSSSVQIVRQGNYNEAQRYWPVQATVSGTSRREPQFYMGDTKPSENCRFSFFLEYAIKKNDYGEWIAAPPPFFMGPVDTKCGQ
jgi:hypothetical protein